jgi:hypothetical protein
MTSLAGRFYPEKTRLTYGEGAAAGSTGNTGPQRLRVTELDGQKWYSWNNTDSNCHSLSNPKASAVD